MCPSVVPCNSLWKISSAKALAFPVVLPFPFKCSNFFRTFEVPSPTTKTGWFCHPPSKLFASLMHATALTARGLVNTSPEMHSIKHLIIKFNLHYRSFHLSAKYKNGITEGTNDYVVKKLVT